MLCSVWLWSVDVACFGACEAVALIIFPDWAVFSFLLLDGDADGVVHPTEALQSRFGGLLRYLYVITPLPALLTLLVAGGIQYHREQYPQRPIRTNKSDTDDASPCVA